MKCVLSLNVLYPYFKGYFSLGAHVSQSETAQFAFGKHAGRKCKGKNHRERGFLRSAHISPLPKVLSLALPLSLPSPL